MSKGIYLLGQSRGKIGSIVTYVAKGEQRQRVYTAAGARKGMEASLPARAQRVAFGGASNEWQLYRYICTRMFRRGKKTNESDYNYFVRINFNNLPYLLKWQNEAGLNYFMPGYYSHGDLGSVPQFIQIGSVSQDIRDISIQTSNISANEVLSTKNLSVLKDEYKRIFTNADKISILVGKYSQYSEREHIEFAGPIQVEWKVVTLLLSGESKPGENTKSIGDFLNESLGDMIVSFETNAPVNITNGGQIFKLKFNSANINEDKGYFMALFATNESANNCYTTLMQSTGASETNHPFNRWMMSKTQSALDAACASYGYQSSVMQSVIVEVGSRVEDIIESDAANIADMQNLSGEDREQFISEYAAAAREKNTKRLTDLLNAAIEQQAIIDGQAEADESDSMRKSKK